MPDNQSPEKFDILRALGVELELVRPVPYADANHYQKVARRRAEEIPGAVWANQFDNTANRDGHYSTTGPEIWRDTDGRLDAFVAASGTGGTFGGAATFLKEQGGASLRTVLADPQGSALYRWVKTGELKAEGPGSITEGIGIGRVTANLKDAPIDDALHVTDAEAVAMVHGLLRDEGLFLGSAAGVNVAGAVRVAQEMGPGHRIVTILCDSGHKYTSRLYNREWLESRGLANAAFGGA
jgi:cysteine synthase